MRRSLAPETKSLIEALHKHLSFWQNSTSHKVTTLALISDTSDPAAIPDIVSLLLNPNRRVAQAAANAVSALAGTLNPADLPWLDQQMRQRSPYRWSYPSAWADMKPEHVGFLRLFGESSVSALGMASFHFSGYVREESLRKLSESEDGTELPFLLLRLNDWVKPVRETAHRLIRERLRPDYAPFLVINILLVNRLRLLRRDDQQNLLGAVEHLLASQECRAALETGLGSLDRQVRRACYDIALRGAGTAGYALILHALSDPDPAVRLDAAGRISCVAESELKERLAATAMRDRFAPVRHRGLEVLSNQFPDKALPWLELALLDSHRSVRGYAQFQLGRGSAFDLGEFYRGALSQPASPALYATISGIGETGTATDASLVVPHVSHKTPRIRRAALRALANLNPVEFVDVFRTCMADQSPAVSREAMKGLSKTRHLSAGEDLWTIFGAHSELHVRRNTLFLIARLSKWESIGYLVQAVDADNEEVRKLARSYIRRWCQQFNSTFTAPTRTQSERLTSALHRSGALLDSAILRSIEYGLRAF